MNVLTRPILCAILCFPAWSACTGSPNCTVKAGGGGGYTTIQACATAMANGDTCTVFAGTYNEHVTLSAGGALSYKTLNVNTGDLVYVLDFTIDSHNKVIGFQIQNPSSPTNAPCVSITANATDYYITNNVMYACGTYMIKEQAFANTTHGFIQGNTLSYSCSTSGSPNVCTAMQINGDYHLIENNDISHVSDGLYVFGSHNVLRGNTMHDINISDCGSNSGNCHIDFMQSDSSVPGGQPSQYLLVEGNTVIGMVGANTHALGLLQAEACGGQCFNAIIRFHTAAHIGGGGIIDDNSGVDTPAGWSNVKSYNNSWVDMNNLGSDGEATNGYTHTSTGASEINDLFYYARSWNDFNPYFTDASTVGTFSVRNNLGYCTGSPCTIHGKIYGSGAFTDDPGNIKVDPQFVNYSSNNFHLATGSPAIASGSYLTTVAGGDSGTGTSLVVTDAGYFQDGSGITGVQADWIRVGSTTTVQVSSINYSTNTITLANTISRSNTDPIYLYKNSSGAFVIGSGFPDIGAFPYQTPPAGSGLSGPRTTKGPVTRR